MLLSCLFQTNGNLSVPIHGTQGAENSNRLALWVVVAFFGCLSVQPKTIGYSPSFARKTDPNMQGGRQSHETVSSAFHPSNSLSIKQIDDRLPSFRTRHNSVMMGGTKQPADQIKDSNLVNSNLAAPGPVRDEKVVPPPGMSNTTSLKRKYSDIEYWLWTITPGPQACYQTLFDAVARLRRALGTSAALLGQRP
ncbi:hypothetical protein FE257_002302 [Aspergillus nanangensis]|uniref:Uncharacterized protein n=1 Tax=Aspergillus nanangensis TaxID=2582783 RepID=A0AAD4CE49_ASPNN|nr:hypothetical protein FE257_002302 [Aspergillus nanangensis]